MNRAAKLLAGFALQSTARLTYRQGKTAAVTGGLRLMVFETGSILQAVLILAFLPALHRISRDVSYLFPSLYEQDVCQQVLAAFLRVSLSRSIQRRTGFVPIAITRTVRMIVFRWAFSRMLKKHGMVSFRARRLRSG